MRTTIRLGDKIRYRTFGNNTEVSYINGIQICKPGEKYGKEVELCNIAENKYGTVTMSNMHWCWFDDILDIFPLKNRKSEK